MKKNLTDFRHNLVTLSNSILKHYKVTPFNKTFPKVDILLKENKSKPLVLFLFDGFGKEIIKENTNELSSTDYLDLTSVFPPTTMAATNSLLSGKYPKETGCLGWSQYFEEYGKNIDCFPNTDSLTHESISKNYFKENLHYDNIIELINKKGKYKASSIFSFNIANNDIKPFFEETQKIADKNDFTYAYLTSPDSAMHKYGSKSEESKHEIDQIISCLHKFVLDNKDKLILVIGDHGHKDITIDELEKDSSLKATLSKPFFTIEQRAPSFFVDEDKKEQFYKRYSAYYQNFYDLYTKKEILEGDLFGLGIPHKLFSSFIGDFTFVATKDHCLLQNGQHAHKSTHAGMTEREMNLALLIYNN